MRDMDRAARHRPGDILLDRYFSGADEAAREAARAQYTRFVSVLLRVAVRLAEEKRAAQDSPKPERRLKIPIAP